jgi:hypothetical protein
MHLKTRIFRYITFKLRCKFSCYQFLNVLTENIKKLQFLMQFLDVLTQKVNKPDKEPGFGKSSGPGPAPQPGYPESSLPGVTGHGT